MQCSAVYIYDDDTLEQNFTPTATNKTTMINLLSSWTRRDDVRCCPAAVCWLSAAATWKGGVATPD